MASVYDILVTATGPHYRINKQFLAKDKVPAATLEVLDKNPGAIVDENGMILVDDKSDSPEWSEPTEDNVADLAKMPAGEGADPNSAPPADHDTTLDHAETVSDNTQGTPDGTTNTPEDQATPPAAAAPVVGAGPEPTPPPAAPVPPTPPAAPVSPAPAAAPVQPNAPAPAPTEKVERFRSKVPQSKPGMGFPRKNGKTSDIFDINVPHTHLKLVGGITVPLSAENFKTKSEGQILKRLKELGFEPIDFNAIEREKAMARANPGNDLSDDLTDTDTGDDEDDLSDDNPTSDE